MTKKRGISFILATIMIAQTASKEATASDWFDGYQTGSTPKQWTDGGGGKYLYGGDVSYRFKRNTVFKPVLDIRPPGIKAGCNGISISGGFIHFLGLDEIKEQLQSAGQGAMMGVVVGIVYSLPGIADAFDKVQKYVRLLQQILSQSCQMTAQLTKQWIDKQRDISDKNGGAGQNGFEYAVGTAFQGLQSTVDSWNTALNKGDAALEAEIKKLTTTEEQSKKIVASSATTLCNATCQAAKKGSITEIKNYVDANKEDADKVYVRTNISTLSSFITNEERRKSIEFAIVFLGYYGVDKFPAEMTKDEFAAYMTQQLKTGGKAEERSAYNRGLFFSGGNVNGDQLVKALLYGPSDGSDSLKLPNIAVMPFFSQADGSGGSIADLQVGVLFGSKDTATNATGYVYPWKGLVREGKEYLRDLVVNGSTTAQPTIPSVIPGMSRYVNVLKTQYRKGGNDAYVLSLIDMLAKKNAVMLLQSIVYEMQSIMAETIDDSSKESYKAAIDAIYKELDRMNSSDSSIADTIEIFERIEQSHARDITGNARDR